VRHPLSILAAVIWLAFLAMVVGIHQARFDRPVLILGAVALCGSCLALAMTFRHSRWMIWASLLLSIPVASWNFIWFFHVRSLLSLKYGIFAHAQVESLLGRTPFLWFCLAVTVLMICMPFGWIVTLRRRQMT